MVTNNLCKIALVTGANKGMGYQTALALASRNYKVIMADKDDQTQSQQKIVDDTCNNNIIAKHLDLASFKSIRNFTEELTNKKQHLDILVNNAGVFCVKNKKTSDGLDGVMQVNHFGPFLLTSLLVELLKMSGQGRIIFVTSSGAFLHNLTVESLLKPRIFYPKFVATVLNYYNSKLCNMITSKGFAERLKKCNVTSNCLHPGMSNTSFLIKRAPDDGFVEKMSKEFTRNVLKYTTSNVEKSSGLAVFLATSKSVQGISGEYFVNYQVRKQPRVLEDYHFCDSIWKETERLVGIENREKQAVESQ